MKIRTWHFSYNSYIKFKLGTVSCIERPLWVFLGDWFVNSVVGRFCCLFHWVKLPDWWKIQDDGHIYTLAEYYGDLGSIWHVYVFDPIFQWWWRIEERNQKEWRVEIGYDKLKEIFGADFKELEPVREDIN